MKKNGKMLQKIVESYLDPNQVGTLGGLSTFLKSQRQQKNRKKVEKALQSVDAYSIHKARRRTFPRNPVIVTNLRQQFQTDLMDIQKYSRMNGGAHYIMLTVDLFSKMISCQLLKKKTGENVQKAFVQVFQELGVPEKLQVDKGN
jgi:hypothetical protein